MGEGGIGAGRSGRRDEALHRLWSSFGELRALRLDLPAYPAPVRDVAADLFTWEAGIAGIADAVVGGGRPPAASLAILRRPLPLDGLTWRVAGRQPVDLTGYAPILRYAAALDRVRRDALAVLSG